MTEKKETNKFLNVRIGVEFYHRINAHPVFQSNWKAISPAFYFLQRVARYNADGNPVEFSSQEISKIFQPYTKGVYRPYMTALEELGLLAIDHTYVVGDKNAEGRCKRYRVTDAAVELLHSSNTEYLKKLHKDKKTMRRNQKSISQRKVMTKTYSDYVLGYIHDGLVNFEYDLGQAMAVISGSSWTPETKQSAGDSLVKFKEKDFTDLKYNHTDGRVFNEFVAMKSDLRRVFNYKKMIHRAVIDVRACHPTFFSHYLFSLYFNPTNPILHYVPHKADKSSVPANICENALKKEHAAWVELFTNPNTDPRDVIAKDCGYSRDTCKRALNETINGSGLWKGMLRWIESNYPNLFRIWSRTDKRTTGVAISKQYESVMMLDTQLFEHTEGMGIKLAYEYDGCSVFAMEGDPELRTKLDFVVKYLRWIAQDRWGVPVVIKVEVQK